MTGSIRAGAYDVAVSNFVITSSKDPGVRQGTPGILTASARRIGRSPHEDAGVRFRGPGLGPQVQQPVLLVVGGEDRQVIDLNEQAAAKLEWLHRHVPDRP